MPDAARRSDCRRDKAGREQGDNGAGGQNSMKMRGSPTLVSGLIL